MVAVAAAEPRWLGLVARLVRRMPRGRYFLAQKLASSYRLPFVARMDPTLGGVSFQCDLADAICREVYFTGLYEPAKTHLAASLVRSGDTVIDLGANWGYFTLACAHWAGPTGGVVAFEPDGRMFDVLKTNVGMNRLSNVSLIHGAVGATRGIETFVGYEEGSHNRGVTRRVPDKATIGTFRSEVVSLDEWLPSAGLNRVRLVKMDIEGDEYPALLGMREGLAAAVYDFVLLECHPIALGEQGVGIDDVLATLRDAHYEVSVIDLSPSMYRRAARQLVRPGDLLSPYVGQPLSDWPHFLACSPRAIIQPPCPGGIPGRCPTT